MCEQIQYIWTVLQCVYKVVRQFVVSLAVLALFFLCEHKVCVYLCMSLSLFIQC